MNTLHSDIRYPKDLITGIRVNKLRISIVQALAFLVVYKYRQTYLFTIHILKRYTNLYTTYL